MKIKCIGTVIIFERDFTFKTEMKLNKIPGVVENGIFSARKADVVIVSDGEKTYELE